MKEDQAMKYFIATIGAACRWIEQGMIDPEKTAEAIEIAVYNLAIKAPVSMLNLSNKSAACLKRMHIFTLKSLTQISKEGLRTDRWVTDDQIGEIESKLNAIGLSLAQG